MFISLKERLVLKERRVFIQLSRILPYVTILVKIHIDSIYLWDQST